MLKFLLDGKQGGASAIANAAAQAGGAGSPGSAATVAQAIAQAQASAPTAAASAVANAIARESLATCLGQFCLMCRPFSCFSKLFPVGLITAFLGGIHFCQV